MKTDGYLAVRFNAEGTKVDDGEFFVDYHAAVGAARSACNAETPKTCVFYAYEGEVVGPGNPPCPIRTFQENRRGN